LLAFGAGFSVWKKDALAVRQWAYFAQEIRFRIEGAVSGEKN
jgi:hypothetical protein